MVFGAALGTLLGATGASIIQSLGVPFWETGHDFEGWFFGQKVNLKKAREPRPVEVIASQ